MEAVLNHRATGPRTSEQLTENRGLPQGSHRGVGLGHGFSLRRSVGEGIENVTLCFRMKEGLGLMLAMKIDQ